jgi:hypothetical protein
MHMPGSGVWYDHHRYCLHHLLFPYQIPTHHRRLEWGVGKMTFVVVGSTPQAEQVLEAEMAEMAVWQLIGPPGVLVPVELGELVVVMEVPPAHCMVWKRLVGP